MTSSVTSQCSTSLPVASVDFERSDNVGQRIDFGFGLFGPPVGVGLGGLRVGTSFFSCSSLDLHYC